MSVPATLRNLFKTADAISIDDSFYRYFNNSASDNDNYEICLTFENEHYVFLSEDLDSAIFNDDSSDDPNTFHVHSSQTGYSVTLRFYNVSVIKPTINPLQS